jgi:hypothetical protein
LGKKPARSKLSQNSDGNRPLLRFSVASLRTENRRDLLRNYHKALTDSALLSFFISLATGNERSVLSLSLSGAAPVVGAFPCRSFPTRNELQKCESRFFDAKVGTFPRQKACCAGCRLQLLGGKVQGRKAFDFTQ